VDVSLLLDEPATALKESLPRRLLYLFLMIGFPLGLVQLASVFAAKWPKSDLWLALNRPLRRSS